MFAELVWLAPDHPRRRGLRAELIIGYLPVALNIARKRASLGESLADVEQVAALGLVLAVDRFDPGRGADFLAFAIPTIDGEVLRYHRDRSTIVRTPRPIHRLRRSIMRTVDELSQRLAHIPNASEIAHELDLDPDTVADVLSAERAVRCASLDEPFHEDTPGGDGRLERSLGRADPELSRVEDRLALRPLIKALPERERRILQLRFVEGLTQGEIGQRIGVSQMHVSRLIAATLAGLRRKLTSR
jgi:RNA polymerase sigma-B factor